MYEMNSFLVSEGEEDLEGSAEEEDEHEFPLSQSRSRSTPEELDELEQAEAILRERRRARRLQKHLPKAKRRRRKIMDGGGDGSSSSDDEGEELRAFRREIHSIPSD